MFLLCGYASDELQFCIFIRVLIFIHTNSFSSLRASISAPPAVIVLCSSLWPFYLPSCLLGLWADYAFLISSCFTLKISLVTTLSHHPLCLIFSYSTSLVFCHCIISGSISLLFVVTIPLLIIRGDGDSRKTKKPTFWVLINIHDQLLHWSWCFYRLPEGAERLWTLILFLLMSYLKISNSMDELCLCCLHITDNWGEKRK